MYTSYVLILFIRPDEQEKVYTIIIQLDIADPTSLYIELQYYEVSLHLIGYRLQ